MDLTSKSFRLVTQMYIQESSESKDTQGKSVYFVEKTRLLLINPVFLTLKSPKNGMFSGAKWRKPFKQRCNPCAIIVSTHLGSKQNELKKIFLTRFDANFIHDTKASRIITFRTHHDCHWSDHWFWHIQNTCRHCIESKRQPNHNSPLGFRWCSIAFGSASIC